MPKPAARSRLRYPLDDILGNVGKVRVLRMVFQWPGPVAIRQIADETGMTPQGVRHIIESLVADGVLQPFGTGRMQLYARRAQHPWTQPLQTLFETEGAVWESITRRIRAVVQADRGIKSAWLYGSVARGEDRTDSDIDVALVVTPKMDTMKTLDEFAQIEQDLHVSISPVFVNEDDVESGKVNPAWWRNVLAEGKQLKGGAHQPVPQWEAAEKRK